MQDDTNIFVMRTLWLRIGRIAEEELSKVGHSRKPIGNEAIPNSLLDTPANGNDLLESTFNQPERAIDRTKINDKQFYQNEIKKV